MLIVASGKEKEISKAQFYQALADSMAARMLPESEKQLCKAVEVIDASTFPSEMSAEYGEQELKGLCTRFSVEFGETKIAYRLFKDSRGSVVQPAMKALINLVNTIPVSTAECERGFSKMNLVCNSLRSRLTVKHISSLMFVSLTGPPLTLWQPLPYVKSWLLLNRRAATCSQWPCQNKVLDIRKESDSIWKFL